MKIQDFLVWMNNTFDVEFVEIMRCIKAIEEVSFRTPKYDLPQIDLFEKGTISIVDTILANRNFKRADTKVNKMYSSALNIFKDFLNQITDINNDVAYQDDLIIETISYEKKVRVAVPIKSRKTVVDIKRTKPNYMTVNNQKIWSRNSIIASEALASKGYFCEIDKDHQHFISKFNKQNYVEAHHFIPMKFQEQFDCSLDVHANIVSLCLVCHKKLHFSSFTEKKEVLQKLFAERSIRLLNAGINVQIDDLYSFYQD